MHLLTKCELKQDGPKKYVISLKTVTKTTMCYICIKGCFFFFYLKGLSYLKLAEKIQHHVRGDSIKVFQILFNFILSNLLGLIKHFSAEGYRHTKLQIAAGSKAIRVCGNTYCQTTQQVRQSAVTLRWYGHL